ncbi:hypothetical protein [Streptomyces lavendulocolor]|uniref:hypothetical protein n=1 Tax=Streptomyces lavendulocolor TaxID=67316 RepID=UPI0031E1B2A7
MSVHALTPETPETPVADFGTGFLTTRILGNGVGYQWTRVPGPDREDPFTSVPESVRAATVALGLSGVRVELGRGGRAERRYPAPLPYTLAHVLTTLPKAPEKWAAMPRLLHDVGVTVRRVHDEVRTGPVVRRPSGGLRLSRWLARRDGPGGAARLSEAAGHRLGRQRTDRVRHWLGEWEQERPDDVLVLGAVGLGAVIPPRPPQAGVLLAGEELARGPRAYDLGWLLGELAEFRLLHFAGPRHTEAAALCAAATRAVLHGYGPEAADAEAVARAAVLRVLLHAHDYAAYVGWTEQLLDYLDLLAELIDTPAAVGTSGEIPYEATDLEKV